MLGLAVTGFAVYSRIEAAVSAPRIAIALAEYVSREEAPDGDELDALALFLRDHELGIDHALLVVTTAVHKAAGQAPGVLWIDRIALGDKTATKELEGTCKGKGAADGKAALGDHFAMDDGETVFVVEVCARPPASLSASWTGDLRHHYLLPTRHPDRPPGASGAHSPDGGGLRAMPAPGAHPGLRRRAGLARRRAAPGNGRRETGGSTCAPRSLRGFLRETRGAVGLTAAAIAIMFLGGIALVSDHLWMIGKRDLLQRAADAAAIATTFALRRRPASESDAQVEAALRPVAERYARFNVLGNTAAGEIEPEDIEVTLDVDRAAGTVGVSVKADVLDTLFAKWLYGYEASGELTTRAGAERDTTKAEVVLALDVTRSMDWNLEGGMASEGKPSRMAIVRRAAHTLVDILDPGGGESMVAIGVVPWHINVRLNETMRTAWERKEWAVYPDSKTYPWPYEASGLPRPPSETWPMPATRGRWAGCVDQRALQGDRPPGLSAALPSRAPFTMAFFPVMNGYSYQCRDLSSSGSCSSGGHTTQAACEAASATWTATTFPGDFTQKCYHGQTNWERSRSHSCPAALGTCSQQRRPAQYICSSDIPILPLNQNMSEVRNAIDALIPIGDQTYSTMGLIWGTRLLTPKWRRVWGGRVHPVNPSKNKYLGVRKAIVLLTDGEDNYDDRIGAAPNRSEACTAAKDAGIEIFVVAAMNPSKIGSELSKGLTDCSSQSGHPDRTYVFLDNHTREDLEDAFRQIAQQLLVVRRTH